MAATKRRDYGSGSVYQRASDGRWVGTLELGWEKGKRVRKVVSGKTKADAVAKLKAKQKEFDAHGGLALNVPRVDDWLKRWVDDIASLRLQPRTLSSYRSEIKRHINPWLGHYKLDKLTATHILDWHRKLRVEPIFRRKNGGGQPTTEMVGESTVLKAHAVLSKALQDAVRLDLIPRNPARSVDRPKADAKRQRRALTTDEALELLRVVRDQPFGSRWATALMEGVRQGECLGLEWDRVLFDTNQLDVSWQLQRLHYRHGCDDDPCGRKFAGNCPQKQLEVPPSLEYEPIAGALCLTRPKGERSRIVPMTPQLHAWLRRERQERPDDRFVWCRADGRPIDPREDYGNAKVLLRSLGHDDVTLYEFRHTTASLLLRLGVPESIRMEIMGHSVIATQRGYAHADDQLRQQAMELLGSALSIEQAEEA